MGRWFTSLGLIMKSLLVSILCLLSTCVFGAVPDFKAFLGTNGGRFITNVTTGKIIFDPPTEYGRTLFVDSINGNDATARRGESGLPWANPEIAALSGQSGDVVLVRSGDYGVTNGIVLPHGVSLIGQGAKTTRLINRVVGAENPCINPGSGSLIYGLTVTNVLFSTPSAIPGVGSWVYQSCIGVGYNDGSTTQHGFTNATIRDCEFYGETDVLVKKHQGANTWEFIGCLLLTHYDMFVQFEDEDGGASQDSRTLFQGVQFVLTHSGALQSNALLFCKIQSEKIRVQSCMVIITNTFDPNPSTVNLLLHQASGATEGALVTFNNTAFFSTAVMTAVFDKAATLNKLGQFNDCTLNGVQFTVPHSLTTGGAGIGLLDASKANWFTNTIVVTTNIIVTNIANNVEVKFRFTLSPGATLNFAQRNGTFPELRTNGEMNEVLITRFGTTTNFALVGGYGSVSFVTTNYGSFSFIATNLLTGQQYTNLSQRGFVVATVSMTNVLAGDVSAMSLLVDQDANGSYETTNGPVRINGVALSAGSEQLFGILQPGALFVFTNQNAGITPSATIISGSCQWSRW